jgi:hypothetical protein
VQKLAGNKHSGLIRKFANYGQKMFYDIGPSTDAVAYLVGFFVGDEGKNKL